MAQQPLAAPLNVKHSFLKCRKGSDPTSGFEASERNTASSGESEFIALVGGSALYILYTYMGERGYWSKEQNKTKNDPKAASSRERKKQLHVRAENRTISLQSSLFDPG